MRALYFAYASNMDEREMRARCPSARCLGAARLDAHRLAFSRRSVMSGTGVADVVPAADGEVWGVLYGLDEEDLDALDRKEGNGWAYKRERQRVTPAAGGPALQAILYAVIEKEPHEVPPSREYLGRVLRAAEAHALPPHYVAMLEAHDGSDALARPREGRGPSRQRG
jgi:gamma-glutamylcyclotransferase